MYLGTILLQSYIYIYALSLWKFYLPVSYSVVLGIGMLVPLACEGVVVWVRVGVGVPVAGGVGDGFPDGGEDFGWDEGSDLEGFVFGDFDCFLYWHLHHHFRLLNLSHHNLSLPNHLKWLHKNLLLHILLRHHNIKFHISNLRHMASNRRIIFLINCDFNRILNSPISTVNDRGAGAGRLATAAVPLADAVAVLSVAGALFFLLDGERFLVDYGFFDSSPRLLCGGAGDPPRLFPSAS